MGSVGKEARQSAKLSCNMGLFGEDGRDFGFALQVFFIRAPYRFKLLCKAQTLPENASVLGYFAAVSFAGNSSSCLMVYAIRNGQSGR